MYRISDSTKSNLERSLGIRLDDFSKMSAEEERIWVEKRAGRKLHFSKARNLTIIGRGNPLLARRKIRTADDLEEKSKKFYGF